MNILSGMIKIIVNRLLFSVFRYHKKSFHRGNRMKYLLLLLLVTSNSFSMENTDEFKDCSPLIRACINNRLQAAQWLLEWGADANAKDITGKTPLHFVAECTDNAQFVELLLNNGADINIKAPFGLTPIQLAQINSHWKAANKLLEYGAIVEKTDLTPFVVKSPPTD